MLLFIVVVVVVVAAAAAGSTSSASAQRYEHRIMVPARARVARESLHCCCSSDSNFIISRTSSSRCHNRQFSSSEASNGLKTSVSSSTKRSIWGGGEGEGGRSTWVPERVIPHGNHRLRNTEVSTCIDRRPLYRSRIGRVLLPQFPDIRYIPVCFFLVCAVGNSETSAAPLSLSWDDPEQ